MTPEWKDFQFLLANGRLLGAVSPARGPESFYFDFELGGKIFVRRNHLEFAATRDNPAFAHDDQLITYKEETGEMRAIYFDNEGHTIHYKVTLSPEGDLVYISDAIPGYRASA